MNRNQLKQAYLNDRNINTDRVVVVSMRSNKQLSEMTRLLRLLNYSTNYCLNRYSLKKNSKFPRVGFYCNNEDAFNNTHSHVYLSVPPCYEFDRVVELMKVEWAKLDRVYDRQLERYIPNPHPSFDLYSEVVVNDDAYAIYSVKDFDNINEDTFVPI